MREGEGNQAWNIFCCVENIQVWVRVREDKLHKVRPPGGEAAEEEGDLNMKVRRMLLAVFALIVLGGLAVPANALGHHHRHHHHRHHKR